MNLSLRLWTCLGLAACLALSVGCGNSNHSNDGGVTDGGPNDAGTFTPNDPIGLWSAGKFDYSTPQLSASSGATPSTSCPLPNNNGTYNPSAFDGAGNLWAQGFSGSLSSLNLWTAAQLSTGCASGQPSVTVAVANTDFGQAAGFAFDTNGTLWVSFPDDQLIAGFGSDQLTTSATVNPRFIVVAGDIYAAALYTPRGLAFDAAGALWVGNGFSVLKYSAASLSAATYPGGTINPRPDGYVSTQASKVAAQMGTVGTAPTFNYVAFDSSGNLWVSGNRFTAANFADYVAQYAASDLAAIFTNNTPTPRVVLHETSEQAAASVGFGAVALDSSGNLWLAESPNRIERYPAANIGVGGSTASDVLIGQTPADPSGSLAFNPIPSGLPIRP
jgi:hypothetical protein